MHARRAAAEVRCPRRHRGAFRRYRGRDLLVHHAGLLHVAGAAQARLRTVADREPCLAIDRDRKLLARHRPHGRHLRHRDASERGGLPALRVHRAEKVRRAALRVAQQPAAPLPEAIALARQAFPRRGRPQEWNLRLCHLTRRRVIARAQKESCLLYTSPSPRDATLSRMPSSA